MSRDSMNLISHRLGYVFRRSNVLRASMSEKVSEASKGLVLPILSAACLLWYAILWSIGLLGCISARKRYRNRPRSPLATTDPATVPGVSILRPLKGLDPNLYENLESTFTQEYPKFEVLLSVASEDDQALPIARELVSKYPHVNAKVVIGEDIVGINPKVNNLVRSYNQAENDILWVIDSNVQAHPGTLARSVDALTRPSSSGKRIAVVHHVPFAYSTGMKLGSQVEEAFLNTNHAKMYIAINTIAIESCVVGKSNMYRRSDVKRVNGSLKRIASLDPNAAATGLCGLPAFGCYMAEDNMIASALWHELDLRHDLSCDVARNIVGNMSMSDYVWRRVRWIRVRKHMVLAATLVEPFTESLLMSILAAASLRCLVDFPPWLFFMIHHLAWLYVDLDVYASLAEHPLPSSDRVHFLIGWFVREVMALPIFLFAIFGNTVTWRGKQYKILKNGEAALAGGDAIPSKWFRRPNHYEPLSVEETSV